MSANYKDLKTAGYLVGHVFPERWAEEYAGKLGNPMIEAAIKEVAEKMARSVVVDLVNEGSLLLPEETTP